MANGTKPNGSKSDEAWGFAESIRNLIKSDPWKGLLAILFPVFITSFFVVLNDQSQENKIGITASWTMMILTGLLIPAVLVAVAAPVTPGLCLCLHYTAWLQKSRKGESDENRSCSHSLPGCAYRWEHVCRSRSVDYRSWGERALLRTSGC